MNITERQRIKVWLNNSFSEFDKTFRIEQPARLEPVE
jgi:hypothetical protein